LLPLVFGCVGALVRRIRYEQGFVAPQYEQSVTCAHCPQEIALQIFIDGEGAEPLFDAIKEAPFSPAFKQLFIDEILTAPGLRFGARGILGFFDGAGMEALGTGDYVSFTKLSRAGELMAAALRALRCAAEDESGHTKAPVQSVSCPE
jgi:hypothetical protein